MCQPDGASFMCVCQPPFSGFLCESKSILKPHNLNAKLTHKWLAYITTTCYFLQLCKVYMVYVISMYVSGCDWWFTDNSVVFYAYYGCFLKGALTIIALLVPNSRNCSLTVWDFLLHVVQHFINWIAIGI